MQGIELENAMKSDFLCSQLYIGLFSSDELPVFIEPNKILIFNQAKSSNKIGLHQILISTVRPNFLDVLSSIKIPNLQQTFPNLQVCAKNTNRTIYEFKTSIQSSFTSNCGCYTILWAWLISRGFSPNDILKEFHSSKSIKVKQKYFNDLKCVILTRTLFKLEKDTFTLLYDIDFLSKLHKSENSHLKS